MDSQAPTLRLPIVRDTDGCADRMSYLPLDVIITDNGGLFIREAGSPHSPVGAVSDSFRCRPVALDDLSEALYRIRGAPAPHIVGPTGIGKGWVRSRRSRSVPLTVQADCRAQWGHLAWVYSICVEQSFDVMWLAVSPTRDGVEIGGRGRWVLELPELDTESLAKETDVPGGGEHVLRVRSSSTEGAETRNSDSPQVTRGDNDMAVVLGPRAGSVEDPREGTPMASRLRLRISMRASVQRVVDVLVELQGRGKRHVAVQGQIPGPTLRKQSRLPLSDHDDWQVL